jgi:hypothetical protein
MDKIKVIDKSINIHAYGDGGHVTASFTTATEEEAQALVKALDELTEKVEK